MARSIDTLEEVIRWLGHVEWTVEEFQDASRGTKDWKYISKLKTFLQSLKVLRTVLDGVSCSGALKEALSDLLAEIVTTIEREMESVVH